MQRTRAPRKMLVDRIEAAEMIGCHPNYIKSLTNNGKLPVVKFHSGRNAKQYYRIKDLEAMIDANVVTAE